MEYNEIEKLDDVLSNLANAKKDELPIRTARVIQADIEKIELIEVIQILHRIVKDGFAEKDKTSSNPSYYFYINFDGRLFYNSGGYATKALKDANDALLTQMEIDRRKALDALLATNSTELNILTTRMMKATRWAAVAGFLVFLYYIFSWFCPHYSDCFCKP